MNCIFPNFFFLNHPSSCHQCQLNKEPGQEVQAKRLNFDHVIETNGQSQVFLLGDVTLFFDIAMTSRRLTNLSLLFWSYDQNEWVKKLQPRKCKQPDFLTSFFIQDMHHCSVFCHYVTFTTDDWLQVTYWVEKTS